MSADNESSKTHQLDSKTHQIGEILSRENLPDELKIKLEKIGKRPKNEDVTDVICELCKGHELTAQQILELLGRTDKRHLVRTFLTPLVKNGALRYIYPERGSSPNQAYTAQ